MSLSLACWPHRRRGQVRLSSEEHPKHSWESGFLCFPSIRQEALQRCTLLSLLFWELACLTHKRRPQPQPVWKPRLPCTSLPWMCWDLGSPWSSGDKGKKRTGEVRGQDLEANVPEAWSPKEATQAPRCWGSGGSTSSVPCCSLPSMVHVGPGPTNGQHMEVCLGSGAPHPGQKEQWSP